MKKDRKIYVKDESKKGDKDIAEIEKKVDHIITKNGQNTKKVVSEEINFEKISLYANNDRKIYYIKKKKSDSKKDYDKLSEKIISDARDNLGEDPLIFERADDNIDSKDIDGQGRIKIKFGKKKSSLNKDPFEYKKGEEETPEEVENEADIIPIKEETKEQEKNSRIKPLPKTSPPLIINKIDQNEKDPGLNGFNAELPTKKRSFFGKSEEKEKSDRDKSFTDEDSPFKEDAELLDKKIENANINENTDGKDIAEEKAMQLAKEHIKEIPVKSEEDEQLITKVKGKKPEGFMDLEINQDESKHEHVFFDESGEEDNSFEWSPQVPEKEKKKEPLPVGGSPDLKPDVGTEVGDIELPKELLRSKSVKLSDLGFSENEWEELDFYPLHDPFVYVEILREKDSLDKCYFLVEVELTEDEEVVMDFIHDTMNRLVIDTEELEAKGEEAYLAERLGEVIDEYDIKVKDESREKIFYYVGKNALGLGRIDPLLKDPNIEDISCDGSGVPVFLYHRKYGSLKSNVKFASEDELSSFIFKLAQKCGKHISIAEPMLDATMPDGSRVQMTLSDEITAKGSTFTIRKFREDPFSPPDLVEFNTMSPEMIAYLWIAIENGVNTLFAGGTASGKTTAMNAVSLFIPRESKIVSIEETREINLPHPNWIPGVARAGFGAVVADKMVGEIDMYDLMKAALRQRPEYILVGEIRGREAYVLFQAMATGHATYSTVHADSAQSLIHRLEGKPINIPRVMLQSLDIVCLHVITRVKNKRARRCKQIIEIIDIDPTTKEILTNEVFRWDPVEDRFIYSGKSYILERIRAEKDLSKESMTQEIKNRKKIVEWMNDTNVREFRDVAKLISQYTENPSEVVRLVEKEVAA